MSQKMFVWMVTIISLVVMGRDSSSITFAGSGNGINWHSDYSRAMQRAKRSKKMLFVYFTSKEPGAVETRFEHIVASDKALADDLRKFVPARVSVDTTVVIDGAMQRLIDHPVFAEMKGLPGIAMIDLIDPQSRHYHKVVTIFPFAPACKLDRDRLSVLLDLPGGSLTQRTLVYAIRTHPERPKSADGKFDPILATAAEKHSSHQARIRYQGHHNWNSRFHQINAKLANGMTAQEVCAESWPGETLIEAAEECVDSWRHSSGHWSAVRAAQTLFGYDMKRGRNGVWYATGIFARSR